MQIKKRNQLFILISKIFFTIIDKIIPNDNKLLCYMSYPDISDNSYHIFKFHINKLKNYKFIWIVSDVSLSRKKLKEMIDIDSFNKTKIVSKKSFLGIWYFLRSRHVFHTHGTYFFTSNMNRCKTINLWHGMPIKTIGWLDPENNYSPSISDIYIATSKIYSYIMASAFNANISSVWVTGLPRNDTFAVEPLLDKTQLSLLGISEEDKLIMWLPTFRQSNQGHIRSDSISHSFIDELPNNFLETIDQFLTTKKIKLIIKLHPMDTLNDKECPHYNNIKIVNIKAWEEIGVDLYELLSYSSGLISDISSVIIDYIISGKPIGIFTNSDSNYLRGFVFDIDTNLIPNSIELESIDSTKQFIDDINANIAYEIKKNIFYDIDNTNASYEISKRLELI